MKPAYYSIVTRNSILIVGRCPRPAFDYNVISKNYRLTKEYSNEQCKNWKNLVIIVNHVKHCSCHKGYWQVQSKSFQCYIQYVICMSLVCSGMLSVCHSYVLVCHLYETHMYSYVMRLSLVCGFTMNHVLCYFQS